MLNMDEIQEFDETVFHAAENAKETQDDLIVHNVLEDDNTTQQTAETIVEEQQAQGLQCIYLNKVEEIMQQKEHFTRINEFRENSLEKHEHVLEQKSALSIHLLKEHENINLKCKVDLQFSNKEMEKITDIHGAIKSLENNLDHLNMLTVCCVRDQQEGSAEFEKLVNTVDTLKATNKAKTDAYLHIAQHFSQLEITGKVENAEKLVKYCAMVEEAVVHVNKLKDAIISCRNDEQNMLEEDRVLLATHKEIVEQQDALFHEFTLLKQEHEDCVKVAEDAANEAAIETSELESMCVQNTDRLQKLETESVSLQTGLANQQVYINEMSFKNDELEKTINICDERCSEWNKEIETARQQLKEELEQHEADVELVNEERKHYEEKCAAFELENQVLEECTVNYEKNIYELNVQREKGNSDLLAMQKKLEESQLNLQLVLTNSEKTTNELANTVQEDQHKKQEQLTEVEELQLALQAVNDDIENSKHAYEQLEQDALKTRNKMHTSLSALKRDAREKQESVLKEKQNELAHFMQTLDEQLALKKKECETSVRNCKERIRQHQEEYNNMKANETAKVTDELNKLSEALKNADLQIGEYIPANKNLEEELKLKATTMHQLREKLAQLQRDKEVREVSANSSISLSSIYTDEDCPPIKRIAIKSKHSDFSRMTSTPKYEAKKPKTEDLFDTLFDNPVFHPTKPKI